MVDFAYLKNAFRNFENRGRRTKTRQAARHKRRGVIRAISTEGGGEYGYMVKGLGIA